MFSGLYDVDWSSMQHAYGSAEEVPALLLALCSTDAEERSKALSLVPWTQWGCHDICG